MPLLKAHIFILNNLVCISEGLSYFNYSFDGVFLPNVINLPLVLSKKQSFLLRTSERNVKILYSLNSTLVDDVM